MDLTVTSHSSSLPWDLSLDQTDQSPIQTGLEHCQVIQKIRDSWISWKYAAGVTFLKRGSLVKGGEKSIGIICYRFRYWGSGE